MKHDKIRYTYNGAVQLFDKIVDRHFVGSTWAVSARQAANNLAFRYKSENNLAANAPISLCDAPVPDIT